MKSLTLLFTLLITAALFTTPAEARRRGYYRPWRGVVVPPRVVVRLRPNVSFYYSAPRRYYAPYRGYRSYGPRYDRGYYRYGNRSYYRGPVLRDRDDWDDYYDDLEDRREDYEDWREDRREDYEDRMEDLRERREERWEDYRDRWDD